jgi:dTMP kinase
MGTFITIEGLDGCGKTSVLRLVEQQLKSDGVDVVCTKEPGASTIANRVRDILIDKETKHMDYITETLLYAACRSQHLHDFIIPNLNEGKVVISDRFVDSSYVYQGIARNLGLDQVMAINSLVVKNHIPDLTIFIDIAPEKCLARLKKARKNGVKVDLESLDFNNRVREGYTIIQTLFKDRVVKINGDQPLEKLAKEVYEAIDVFLRGRSNEGIF